MYFTNEKAARYIKDLKKHIFERKLPLKSFKYHAGNVSGAEKPTFDDREWPVIQPGDYWGGKDVTAWFRIACKLPAEFQSGTIALDLVLGKGQKSGLSGAESLVYINGQPVQGLDQNHQEVYLKPEWYQDGILHIAIKAFSGLQNEMRLFEKANLVKINQNTDDFYFRARTVLETVKVLPEKSLVRQRLTNLLNQAINLIDFREAGSADFYLSLQQANNFLREGLSQTKPTDGNRPVITAVGHSHIDVAWLWRLDHTREKCSRTFSTVLHLMDQYPEYQFLQSSPQLYQFIKDDYPAIFEKIKTRIKSGEWEVTGGMWVEADCNVPSGESLVRQFLYGVRFIKEEFGRDCKILWLPDVFGYSWALPQIIAQSGLKYFMTTKISWSQYNRPEYDTFLWRGIDGTEVLTHFITTAEGNNPGFYTYNGMLNPASVQGVWNHYQQKDINDQLLLAYGWGDGGGGPTKDMLESGRIIQDLPGLPELRFGQAEPFFARLAEKVKDNPRLPVVDGELYLEYHRGTYTSQARTKRNNRLSEILYHNVELFNSMAEQMLADYRYPRQEINCNWKTILKNQFHDILPGSSIREVYQDSEKEFKQVLEEGHSLLSDSLQAIAGKVAVAGKKLVVFNPLSWPREGTVTIPYQKELADKYFISGARTRLRSKVINNGAEKEILLYIPEVPALGYRTFQIVEQNPGPLIAEENKVTVADDLIENKYFRIVLNRQGQISSLFDKEADREILPAGGRANLFQAFEDRPMTYDAWDIDLYYREKEYPVEEIVEREIEENGPDRVVIRFKWKFLASLIEQRMIVYSNSRRIDFKTELDWQQHQILLKVAFPVDLRVTKARYEIQFGNVERPTHWNTSWDYAKFETVAQKWADLSEQNYGVSLLNDCKYGYDIKDNLLRLTLIKSGINPDPEADQGRHSFTYSLYPHQGGWFSGGTTVEAFALNYPLPAVLVNSKKGELAESCSFIDVNSNSVILDTVKKAEDSEQLILRFYEYGNQRDRVEVKLAGKIKTVSECNLMEEEIAPLETTAQGFVFLIKPYQLKTFKVELN